MLPRIKYPNFDLTFKRPKPKPPVTSRPGAPLQKASVTVRRTALYELVQRAPTYDTATFMIRGPPMDPAILHRESSCALSSAVRRNRHHILAGSVKKNVRFSERISRVQF